jgi:hypothetical protein
MVTGTPSVGVPHLLTSPRHEVALVLARYNIGTVLTHFLMCFTGVIGEWLGRTTFRKIGLAHTAGPRVVVCMH